MNSVQACYRLLRHCEPGDPAALTVSQSVELIGALSFAIARFFRRSPQQMRQTTVSATLPAKREVVGVPVEHGATSTSGSPFLTTDRGASLLIEGDSSRNEVTGTDTFLDAYKGETGARNLTIFGDAIPVNERILEHILSDPWVNSHEHGRIRSLTRLAKEQQAPEWLQRSDSTPHSYAIQPAAASRGGDVQFVMRIYPAPTEPITIRFEAELHPDSLDASNISRVPVDLPFSDSQIETILLPLAEKELLASTLTTGIDERIAARIIDRAQDAMIDLAAIPNDYGKGGGRIRLRRGY